MADAARELVVVATAAQPEFLLANIADNKTDAWQEMLQAEHKLLEVVANNNPAEELTLLQKKNDEWWPHGVNMVVGAYGSKIYGV